MFALPQCDTVCTCEQAELQRTEPQAEPAPGGTRPNLGFPAMKVFTVTDTGSTLFSALAPSGDLQLRRSEAEASRVKTVGNWISVNRSFAEILSESHLCARIWSYAVAGAYNITIVIKGNDVVSRRWAI